MNKIVFLPLLVGGVTFATATSVSAAIETQIVDYASAADPLAVGGADFPTQLAFQGFDTSLGTLTDIIITLTSTDILQADVINMGAASRFQNARAMATIRVIGPDGVQTVATLVTKPFSGSFSHFPHPNDWESHIRTDDPSPSELEASCSPTHILGPASRATVTSSLHVAAGDFSEYEWNGNVTLDYLLNTTAWGRSFGMGGPGLYFGYRAYSYGQVEIDYCYTPVDPPLVVAVPEPGTIFAGLGALSICGLAMAGRFRNAPSTTRPVKED